MSDSNHDLAQSFAYHNGQWVRFNQISISPLDMGFRQGVTVVERLRTYGGKPFEVERHLERWEHTCLGLKLSALPSRFVIGERLEDLVTKNAVWITEQGEVGITLFATPGLTGGSPTVVLHLNPLDLQAADRRRQSGQPIVISDVVQPSALAWSRQYKVRCRLHYYLADLAAQSIQNDAVAVLRDHDGSLTETSIANFAIVTNDTLYSPSDVQVLRGVTQQVIEEIAAELLIPWVKQSIEEHQIVQAEEVLLMGTDTGLWFANSINGRSLKTSTPGRVYRQLQTAFQRYTVAQ